MGYDPEDPKTALGVGHVPETYTKFLDRNGLKGRASASCANRSVPRRSLDRTTSKVDAVFEKNIAELKTLGAVLTDPVVIPGLRATGQTGRQLRHYG